MSTFSKNLFDVLGDDDDVQQSPAPVKQQEKKAEKPAQADKKASAKPANGAKRDARNTKDRRGAKKQEGRPQRGRQFDRHSGTGLVDNEKKENSGWGKAETAEAEAAADTTSPKDPAAEEAAAAAAAEAEAEEKQKTLDEYLAEKANKSLKVALPEARKANEGTEEDAKWKDAVAFTKQEEPEYFAVKDQKPKKSAEKPKKEKVFVEIEQRFQERPRAGGFRAERGARNSSGRGNGRKGGNNARRGPRQANVNLKDDSAFPSLSASA